MILLLACAGGDSASDSGTKDTDTVDTADSGDTSDTGTNTGPERNLRDAPITVTGPSSSATGNAVAVGDFDGDGAVDLAVAAYYIERTCIFSGPMAGGDRLITDAATCIRGEVSYDYSGFAASNVGDLTGDGITDLFVGAIGNDEGGAFAGKAYLVPGGSSGEVDLGDMDAQWTGEAAADYFGTQVSGVGDVTGDGVDDALIAAPGNSLGAGRVYLVPGGGTVGGAAADIAFTITGEAGGEDTGALLHGETAAGDRLGDGIGGGDIDGDGIGDIAVGGTGSDRVAENAGAVGVFFGPIGGEPTAFADADAIVEGAVEGGYLGAPLLLAYDLDGDGRNDFVYGADGEEDGAGVLHLMTEAPSGVVSGADSVGQIVGEVASDEAGKAFSVAGDLDGDGALDLLIGAPGNDATDADSGAAYLVNGPFGPGVWTCADADIRWRAEGSGDAAGRAVAGGGDLDGDGDDDVAIGASYSAAGGSFAGRVFVVGW